MKYTGWLIERVRVRAGFRSCKQAEALLDDILAALAESLPQQTWLTVAGALRASPNGTAGNGGGNGGGTGHQTRVPVIARGWSSSLDM